MPSTYSTSLRLELMADGEKSGTWGTITNTNLGTLIEQGVAGVASVAHDDSASYTLTTNNGSSDEARNAVVLMTGALTADREVIVPDVDKVYIFKNGTSGGFALTFKTSGGTGVTIPNGRAAICYVDSGTGTVNAIDDGYFTDSIYIEGSSAGDFITAESTNAGATSGPDIKLYRNSASPADSDVLSKITFTANTDDGAGGVSVEDVEYASINVSAPETNETSGEAGKMVIALKRGGTTQNYIEIQGGTSADADNDSIVFKTGGNTVLTIDNNQDMLVDTDSKLQFRDSDIYIQSGSDGQLDIDADTEVQITAPTVDIDASTEVNISGNLAVDTNTLYVDAADDRVGIQTTTPSTPLDVRANLSTVYTGTAQSAEHINIFNTGTGAVGLTSGIRFQTRALDATGQAFFIGSTATSGGQAPNFKFQKQVGSTTYQEVAALNVSEAVFNDPGNNYDFRVESNNNDNMLFVDGGSDHVNIGGSADLGGVLNVNGNISIAGNTGGNRYVALLNETDAYTGTLFLQAGGGSAGYGGAVTMYGHSHASYPGMVFIASSSGSGGKVVIGNTGITYADSSQQITAYTDDSEVVINEDSKNLDFRVESQNKTHMLFVDASKDAVQIGANTSQTQGALDVGFFVDEDTTNVMTIRRGLGGNNTSLATGFGFPYLTIGGSEYVSGGNYRGIGFGYWIPNNGYASSRPPAEIAYYDESVASGTKGSLVFGTRDTTVGSDVPVERMRIHADGKVTINETGTDSDFRIEGSGSSSLFFVDAGNDRVGIKTLSPSTDFHVAGEGRFERLQVTDDGSTSPMVNIRADDASPWALQIQNDTYSLTELYGFRGFMANGGDFTWQHNTANYQSVIHEVRNNATSLQTFKYGSYGSIFNENSNDMDFRVESDNQSNMLVVDAAQDRVKIGGSDSVGNGTNAADLSINGTYGQVVGNTSTQIFTVAMGGNATVTLGTYTGDSGATISAHLSGHHHYSTASTGTSAPLGVYQIMSVMRKAGTSYTVVNNQVVDSYFQGGASIPSLEFDNSNGQLKVVTVANQGCYAEIKVVFQTNFNGVWTPAAY